MSRFARAQHQSQQRKSLDITSSMAAATDLTRQLHPNMRLERAFGNQAVRHLLHPHAEEMNLGLTGTAAPRFGHDFSRIPVHSPAPVAIQTKLAISQPSDEYEREADHVSQHVMGMPEPQRQDTCACGGGCPRCSNEQGGHEQLQTKRVRANGAGEMTTPPTMAHELISSPGQPLDANTRGFMESRFGQDFSRVRIHTGPRADDAANAVQARAFTLGHDIVFNTGQYAPHGDSGQKLLAHELTHVIQQRTGVGISAAHASGAPKVSRHASALSVQRQKAKPAETKTDDPAFWEWWKLVVGFEGDFEAWKKNPGNKNDRGKETNFGITKGLYMMRAKSVGLPATDEGFAAMTADQAVLFGRMMWKSSGASKVKNTGVALVLADWYWGGIDLGRFSAILKAKGRAATFDQGKPDDATIAFMNTLPPSDLVALMSDAKAAQYRAIVKQDATQKGFLEGWLKRNEERRQQAQPFVVEATPVILERGERALKQARDVLQKGGAASSEEKKAARDEVWTVIGRIEAKQKAGFANAEEETGLKNLKGQLLKESGRLMDAGL
jgi:lysozyme family protein